MCPPDYFGVDYVINPWMAAGLGQIDTPLAKNQWENLKNFLVQEAGLAFVAPQRGLPDMVFTANAGMVLGKSVIVSRFHALQRQGEEIFFREWFRTNGFEIIPWPEDVLFEGAGDALFDRGQSIIWAAYGFRSDEVAPPLLEKIFKRRTVSLHLVDPHFYHLDTCLCPLEGGYVMYYPAAFDEASQKTIAKFLPEDKRIIIEEIDALEFACNAVDVNRHVVMNKASAQLQDRLRRLGFTPIIIPLSEYMKSGGSAKCLTLKLVES